MWCDQFCWRKDSTVSKLGMLSSTCICKHWASISLIILIIVNQLTKTNCWCLSFPMSLTSCQHTFSNSPIFPLRRTLLSNEYTKATLSLVWSQFTNRHLIFSFHCLMQCVVSKLSTHPDVRGTTPTKLVQVPLSNEKNILIKMNNLSNALSRICFQSASSPLLTLPYNLKGYWHRRG